MATKTDQLDGLFRLIYPYQQKIILDMAFKRTFVVACQRMWLVFIRNLSCLAKMGKNVL